MLKPHGTLWIGTPNLGSLGARLFRSRWRALEPPRHLVLFTGDSLRLALQRAGFTGVRSVRSIASAPWHFQESAKVAGLAILGSCAPSAGGVNVARIHDLTEADEMTFVATRE